MKAVPRVVIDPHLFCLDGACETKEGFEAFAERLVSWAGVIGSSKLQILVSERCIGALLQTNAYPVTHLLRQTIKRFEVSHVSPDLLEKVAQWILELRPSFEDEVDTDEVVFQDDITAVEPEHYLSRLGAECRGEFRHTLVSAALWRSRSKGTAEIFLGSVPDSDAADREVKIMGTADGFFRRNGDLVEFETPKRFEEELLCLFDCNDLIAASGALELWNVAKTAEDVRRAIEFRVIEHQEKGLHPEKIGTWVIGENFVQSLHSWNFDRVESQAELVIDVCARVLLDQPREPLKEFRKSADSKKQKVRDDCATGWRTHLSKRGVGFRLMLWRHGNGTIEFANVANKAECEIY